MSVVRVNKTENFTVMSNHHFKEKGMSLKAKGLLSLMLSLPPNWNYSVSGLVALSKDGKDSVMSALNELQKFGYLIRKRMTDEKGRFQGFEYNIYEQPQIEEGAESVDTKGSEPYAENPNADDRNAGNTNAGNPQQLNTKKLSTKKLNTNDIDKERKKEKKEPIETYDEILASSVVNNELRELYIEYIKMRKMINAPLSNRALKMLITRAERLSHFNIGIQKTMIENAILNNWKSFYLPNLEAEKKQTLQSLKHFYEN